MKCFVSSSFFFRAAFPFFFLSFFCFPFFFSFSGPFPFFFLSFLFGCEKQKKKNIKIPKDTNNELRARVFV